MTRRRGRVPTHVCLVCKCLQFPATKGKHGGGRLGSKHLPRAWCWICEAGGGPIFPVRRLTDAEQAAYRIGGDDAVRGLISAGSQINAQDSDSE